MFCQMFGSCKTSLVFFGVLNKAFFGCNGKYEGHVVTESTIYVNISNLTAVVVARNIASCKFSSPLDSSMVPMRNV